jgi:hypothetical protein
MEVRMRVRGTVATLNLLAVLVVVLAGTSFDGGAASVLLTGQDPAAGMEAPSAGSDVATRTAPVYPLRWRVLYFAADNNNTGRDCQTFIIIRNVSGHSVSFEAEFFAGGTGGSIKILTGTAGVGRFAKVISGTSDHAWPPYDPSSALSAGLSANEGYVNVHASDPRIMAEAVLICTTGGSNTILFTQPIQTLPVGATQEFFQADSHDLGGEPLATSSANELSGGAVH